MNHSPHRYNFLHQRRTIAIGICFFLSLASLLRGEADEALAVALANADVLDNHVRSCRDIINDWGNLISGDKRGLWKALNLENSHAANDRDFPNVVVAFLHGYDTTCSDAIVRGNKLLDLLRQAGRGGEDKPPVLNPLQNASFFTFCWRGDFGKDFGEGSKIFFPIAERAAKQSAPSFAAFLLQLHSEALEQNRPLKLVVITHSLGAKVALEAFKYLRVEDNSKWITCTLLVQAAIQVQSVVRVCYKGQTVRIAPKFHTLQTYDPAKGTSKPPLWDTYISNPEAYSWIEPYSEDGEYFEACGLSQRVLATMSSGDSGLTRWFSLVYHFPFIASTVTQNLCPRQLSNNN